MYKKIFSLISVIIILISTCSCSQNNAGNENVYTPTKESTILTDTISEESNDLENNLAATSSSIDRAQQKLPELAQNLKNKKMAIVYFSIGDDIETVAKRMADAYMIDAIKIEPIVQYEEADFDSSNHNSRILMESRLDLFNEETETFENDHLRSFGIATPEEIETEALNIAKELPAIKKINTNKYDILFVGYPLWYGDAPKAIYTFLKDLKNITIIPFCVSESGSIDASEQRILNFIDLNVEFRSGKNLSKDITKEELVAWANELSINIE